MTRGHKERRRRRRRWESYPHPSDGLKERACLSAALSERKIQNLQEIGGIAAKGAATKLIYTFVDVISQDFFKKSILLKIIIFSEGSGVWRILLCDSCFV